MQPGSGPFSRTPRGSDQPPTASTGKGSALNTVTTTANTRNVTRATTTKEAGQGKRAPEGGPRGATKKELSRWAVMQPGS